MALVVLLPVTLSLVALVAASMPTLVCVVLVPPAVPGMVTVNGQVRVAPAGKDAALPLLATQAPTDTVAPAGVPAAAVQVALVAAVVAETLVQTKLTPGPDRTAPGAAVAGKPLIATLMSAAAPTVMVAVAGVARRRNQTAVWLVQICVGRCAAWWRLRSDVSRAGMAAVMVEPGGRCSVCVTVTLAGVRTRDARGLSLVTDVQGRGVANGVVRLSVTASIRATVAAGGVGGTLSLVALVAPLMPTLVCVVSVPPAVPGMVTVNGQVRVAPTGKDAALPLLATQAPTVTVAPAGVPAVAVQVALVAAVVAETLVQTEITPGARQDCARVPRLAGCR